MPLRRWIVALCCGCAALGYAPRLHAEDGQVRGIKVLPEKDADCSSLKTICESVTRGCKTNDEKAIAIYNFMQLTHYHLAYPEEKGGLGVLREINVYGWSLCGGLHSEEAALWREMGWKWRYVGWSDPGHTTVEVYYDGRWHYLDVFLKFYVWMPDPNAPGGRTIAGQQDIKANPSLVTDGLVFDKDRAVYYHKGDQFEVIDGKANWRAPSFLSCGDDPRGILTGIASSNRAGSPTGWGGIVFDSPGYSTDVNLAPGNALTLTWNSIKDAYWFNGQKKAPAHTCRDKDCRNCPAIGPVLEPYDGPGLEPRSYANGSLLFAPDLANDAFLNSLVAKENVKVADGKLAPAKAGAPASITVGLQSPYVMSRASGAADGVEKAEISVDGGKTFQPIQLADFSQQVGGKYNCLVKLSFNAPISALRLEAVVECNRGALPYLSPGKNKIAVSVADPKELGDNRLVVTYAYEPGFRTKSFEDLAGEGAELARDHNTTWASNPTVVQKVFSAKDLPATCEIDVPTPEGKYPIYPRMLFVRREVLAPGAKPQATPEGAEAPKPAAEKDLKTLPSPFTVGIVPPPKKAVRPTTKRTIILHAGPVVSQEGAVEENHYLKSKKGETWVMLVDGHIQKLPAAADIADAKLVFPVTHGTDQAATKVGVSLLTDAPEKGKPFDFKNLGDVVGTAVVPIQPQGKDYAPPKTFAIDVTRAFKRIAGQNGSFHGFALRVIQDRAVDEGYITRLDMPKDAEVKLEVEGYDRK
jgi:hypothetical protein